MGLDDVLGFGRRVPSSRNATGCPSWSGASRGSRSPSLFLVKLGAAIRVASTTVPCLSSKPLAVSVALTVARTCTLRLWASSRWRNRRMVLSSGKWSWPMSRPANSRNIGVSYSASSMAGSGQVEPLLKEVDTQQGRNCKRRASALGATRRCVLGNERHQFSPGHHQVHLVEELALARLLGLALKSALVARLICFIPSLSHIWRSTPEVLQIFLSL